MYPKRRSLPMPMKDHGSRPRRDPSPKHAAPFVQTCSVRSHMSSGGRLPSGALPLHVGEAVEACQDHVASSVTSLKALAPVSRIASAYSPGALISAPTRSGVDPSA